MLEFAMQYPDYFTFIVFWLGVCFISCVKYIAKVISKEKIGTDDDGIISVKIGEKDHKEKSGK